MGKILIGLRVFFRVHPACKWGMAHFYMMSFKNNACYIVLTPLRVVLGWAYRGLTGRFLLLQNISVSIL